jgi:hypothetical protein
LTQLVYIFPPQLQGFCGHHSMPNPDIGGRDTNHNQKSSPWTRMTRKEGLALP